MSDYWTDDGGGKDQGEVIPSGKPWREAQEE